MLAATALTMLLAVLPTMASISDSWSDPQTDPVPGERVALLPSDLAKAVTNLSAEVSLSPLIPYITRLTATVTLRNPGPAWLRFVKVDVAIGDAAKLARPPLQYTTLVLNVVKPGETASVSRNDLWVRLLPSDVARAQLKAKAQVIGGFRLTPTVKKAPQ